MRILVLLLLGFAGHLAAATAVTLDGERVEGERLELLSAQRVRIGDRTLALTDLDQLATSERVAQDWPGLFLVLADGGWLPIDRLTAADDDAIVVETPTGLLRFELGQVLAWGTADWLAAADAGTADLVQVGAERYRGRVLGLGDDRLAFEVDEVGEVDLPLDRLSGLRLAESARRPDGLTLAARLDPRHPPVHLRPAEDGRLRFAVAEDQVLAAWPRVPLRVHGGRRVWLSALEPAAVREEGLFGVTWPHSVDVDLDGGPIGLRGRRYERGLVLHSEAELAWDLDGAYQSLIAEVGIEDLVGTEGDVDVWILIDGEERWVREGVRGGEEPVSLRLDLSGAERLVVRVGRGERYDIGDHLALAGAYLVRAR